MLNAIQVIFVVALPMIALISVVKIISEVTSGKVERDRVARKEHRLETMDAGQTAQRMVARQMFTDWDFDVDFGGGIDGIGF